MLWKLFSWNVNGLRAVERKGFLRQFINDRVPDILCLQEVKIDAEAHSNGNHSFPNYREYWNYGERPGYSGTAVITSKKLPEPKSVFGLGVPRIDTEGRVQTLEFLNFYLINAYFPNTRPDLSRLEFKGRFNNKILAHIKKLDKKKPVILTGDYNVAHEEIDIARPRENDGKAGFHPLERKWMGKLLDAGFVDTFRKLHPNAIRYSWWSQRFGARARNVGWRIDYFCVSKRLFSKIKSADVHNKILGSDHCPVSLKMEL